MIRARCLSLSLWVAIGCSLGISDPVPNGEGLNVLFVGNSLTETNNLPATVAAIATLAGEPIHVGAVTGPGLALIDHAKGATNAMSVIRGGGWDVVVLQQGPTTQALCRDTLVLAAQLFDPVVRTGGGTTAVLMAWPYAGFPNAFDPVRASAEDAARAVGGIFMPAGDAWRRIVLADPSIALYGPDGFHPAPAGTFLAALEIYERLSGKDVRTLPAQAFSSGQPFTLPEATIRILQQAAHDANQAYPAMGAPRAPASGTAKGPLPVTC